MELNYFSLHRRLPPSCSDCISLQSQTKCFIKHPDLLPPANVVCEGYVFTPVCDSVNRGRRAWLLRGVGGRGCSGGEGVHVWLLQGGCAWLLRGGMCGCSGGHVWLLWGVCMVAPGGACVVVPGGAWLLQGGGGMRGCSRGHVWLLWGGVHGEGGACVAKGGMCGKGGHVWQRGACVAKGGMCGKGGHAWQRGGVWQKGGCVWYAPPRDTAGHCAGGTHPTGMHSCSNVHLNY